ncbi:MAG: hypothetical protein MJ117_10525, partial [Lachnospiraceae bacterium]|nr:hypothetical protein [Lachnospiraceae bacterium]
MKKRRLLAPVLSMILAAAALTGTGMIARASDEAIILADSSIPVGQDFACLVTSDGEVIWEMAVSSFQKLADSLPERTEYVKVQVLPDNGEKYPYLYPKSDWQMYLMEDEQPEWFTEDVTVAVQSAFEEWKAQAYAIFNPEVLLNFENPQDVEVTSDSVTEEVQALLDEWADVDGNWMTCYVRNSVPTTTQSAVGQAIANDAWNYMVNMVWTQTGEDLAGHSQVDLIAAYVGSAFPGIEQWAGYFGSKTGYPFAEGAKLLESGFLYNNGLFSAKEVKEFDGNYDSEQYKNLTKFAEVNESETGKAFACLVDQDGNAYWKIGTDYAGGLLSEFDKTPEDVVVLNVAPKNDGGNQNNGISHAAAGWEDLGNGYFATGAWEEADAKKPEFLAEDGTGIWKMNEDGSIEPAGEDQSEAGATVNPGKYSYVDGDVTWEVMIAGNGNCNLSEILASEEEEQTEEKERATYFNTPAPMTEVHAVGEAPEWYFGNKDAFDEAAKKAYADWQNEICSLVDADSLSQTLKGLDLDQATPMSEELFDMFKEWVKIWNEDAVAGSINIGISTEGYKMVGPSVWKEMDDTVLANYKSMDHAGCPGPTTSGFIAAYALETYNKVIDAATDDYMGSTMNDAYSALVGSFIKDIHNTEDGTYKYQVAADLWEAGCIPFFDGEYWYLVSGPDKNADGEPAVEVIYSATPEQLLDANF